MGMYDTVVIRAKLPMPEDPKGYSGSDSFQTKDFENALANYEIDENGELSIEMRDGEWVEGDPNGSTFIAKFGHFKTTKTWRERVHFNGMAEVYDFQTTENSDHDYWIQYKLSFADGVLKEASIMEFRATPNEDRKARDKVFFEKLKARSEFCKTWQFRFFCHPFNRCAHFVGKKISSFGNMISRVGSFISIRLHL